MPRVVIRPLQQFLETEASGGLLLLVAASAALVWSNFGGDSYDRTWGTEFVLRVGRWSIEGDLRHWINEAAMSVFFLVVGLEIKRELYSGELRDARSRVVPIAAALGGMVVPALVYVAVTAGTAGARGWGIPMATDIAFAVGVLAIAARRLPSSVRVFLLTLAIVDDLGAILVITFFYSSHISVVPLAIAAILLAGIAALRRIQIRAGAVYLVAGIGVWLAVYQSGVHATIAGVLLAVVTPAAAFQRPRDVSEEARRIADATSDQPSPPDADAPQWTYLAGLSREAVSPLARLQHALHPWTSFVVVPLFALANAGVRLGGSGLSETTAMRVFIGVLAGLVLGKTVGIALGASSAARLVSSRLPTEGPQQLVGLASIGGIGFTVSLFIASLAFTDPALLDAAKVGILVGSCVSGIVGGVMVWTSRRTEAPGDAPADMLG